MKRLIPLALLIFVLLNAFAFMHAYKFTHFTDSHISRTKAPGQLSAADKVKMLLFGVDNPRPENNQIPSQRFEKIYLKSNRYIECWNIKANKSKGTVILFHGYGGQKSGMLDKANEFLKMQYSVLLVDFMGSGGSQGSQTTIGFQEAEQVKTSFEYVLKLGEKNIVLFGTSMGAVAILKSISQFDISPAAIIIECPFGSMYQTVSARFKMLKVPAFPMACLLTFWGGIQNGFWAFSHNPTEYAKSVRCPTLLIYGAKDEKVSRDEIDQIFANLKGSKQLKIFPSAGHENYLNEYKSDWEEQVQLFLTHPGAACL